MGHTCGPIRRLGPLAPLFGLAPGGVCRATECYHRRGALLPHPFTLTAPPCRRALRRFAFCCTFRGLTPPRRYLAPCPGSPDFPPRLRAAIVWPTPARDGGGAGSVEQARTSAPQHRSLLLRCSVSPRSCSRQRVVQLAALAAGERAAIFAACDGGNSSQQRAQQLVAVELDALRSPTARRSRRSRSRRATCRCRARALRSAPRAFRCMSFRSASSARG